MTRNARGWPLVAAAVVGVGALLTLGVILSRPLLMGPAGVFETNERASERLSVLRDDRGAVSRPTGAVLLDEKSFVESGYFVELVYCVDLAMSEVRDYYADALPANGWHGTESNGTVASYTKNITGAEAYAEVEPQRGQNCDGQAYSLSVGIPMQ